MHPSLLLQGLALLLLASACNYGSDPAPGTTGIDADGDGVIVVDDCNDTDASLNFDDADGHSTCDGDCDDVLVGAPATPPTVPVVPPTARPV